MSYISASSNMLCASSDYMFSNYLGTLLLSGQNIRMPLYCTLLLVEKMTMYELMTLVHTSKNRQVRIRIPIRTRVKNT